MGANLLRKDGIAFVVGSYQAKYTTAGSAKFRLACDGNRFGRVPLTIERFKMNGFHIISALHESFHKILAIGIRSCVEAGMYMGDATPAFEFVGGHDATGKNATHDVFIRFAVIHPARGVGHKVYTDGRSGFSIDQSQGQWSCIETAFFNVLFNCAEFKAKGKLDGYARFKLVDYHGTQLLFDEMYLPAG